MTNYNFTKNRFLSLIGLYRKNKLNSEQTSELMNYRLCCEAMCVSQSKLAYRIMIRDYLSNNIHVNSFQKNLSKTFSKNIQEGNIQFNNLLLSTNSDPNELKLQTLLDFIDCEMNDNTKNELLETIEELFDLVETLDDYNITLKDKIITERYLKVLLETKIHVFE